MKQKNTKKYGILLFLLVAFISLLPQIKASAYEEVNSYGELLEYRGNPVVQIRGNVTSIGERAFEGQKIQRFVVRGNAYYTTINGALCSKDGTILVKCPTEKSGSFVVPSSVKKIYANAFSGCSKLTSVTIPDSVGNIGEYAFYGCKNLVKVKLPANITAIKESTFRGCASLENISIPDKVNRIENNAFRGCVALTEVTIPDSVEELGGGIYRGCERLRVVSLSGKLDRIPYEAFDNCIKLKKVEGMKNIRNIDARAFYGCERLEKITLPASLERISYEAFKGCSRLGTVVIPKNTETIENNAFKMAASAFEVKAGNPSYSSRDGLLFDEEEKTLVQAPAKGKGTLHIPDNVNGIYFSALQGTNYRTIILSKGLTKIDKGWFRECDQLETIVLPENTREIRGSYFGGDEIKHLKQIRISDSNTYFHCKQGVIYSKDDKSMIFFPNGKRGTLKLPSNCKNIGNLMEYNHLSQIKIADSNIYFKEIDGVLYNVAGTKIRAFPMAKTSYKIPAKCRNVEYLKQIKEDSNCKEIRVSSKNTKFYAKNGVLFHADTDELLFYPPAKKGAYKVPKSTSKISGNAFRDARYLTKLTISKNVQKGYGTVYKFAGCKKLHTVVVKDGELNYIRMNFDGCDNLNKLVFPSNIMTTKLDYLPSGVTIYGWENTGAREIAKDYEGHFVSRGTIPAIVAGPRVRKIVERYELSWKRSADASGYQIYTGDSTLKNIKGSSVKKCYVKDVEDYGSIYIRAYRMNHGKKVYGKARRLN